MRRRTIAGAIAALCVAAPAAACTTFCLRGPDGPVFGRNYDWAFGDALVLANPRGMAKVSLSARNPAGWVSRYGSLTFNQYGKDSPTGGVNERGLVVEVMELPETAIPPLDSRPALNALEWIQYLLDNHATVEEALLGARRVRLGSLTPAHYLLADATGDAAAVEFIAKRMIVRRGKDLPDRVLANSSYADSLEYLGQGLPDPGPETRGEAGSLARFARAARALRQQESAPPADAVASAFTILDGVAQPGLTQWQVVYDLGRGTVHYRTAANREARRIGFTGLDYACASGGRLIDIDAGAGDVSARLQPYTPQANEKLMLTAFGKTTRFQVPPEAVREEAARVDSRRCEATT